MNWKKLGKVFCPDGSSKWMKTHAMIPIPYNLYGDIYRIIFSSRDQYNRSHAAYVDIDINNPFKILKISQNPLIEPGELGRFDDSGVLPNCILEKNSKKIVFYTGVNTGTTVNFRNSIGIGEWDLDNEFIKRLYPGPIIDRTKDFPQFVATPHVIYHENIFKAWFSTGKEWRKSNNKVVPCYQIEYAESEDCINWKRNGEIAIDFRDQYEYALGVPRVFTNLGLKNQLWFSARASKKNETYRIFYAESNDLKNWERKDSQSGIDVSSKGWDSEMICYPYLFKHKDSIYMLYNGNGYGKSGFGIAVLS